MSNNKLNFLILVLLGLLCGSEQKIMTAEVGAQNSDSDKSENQILKIYKNTNENKYVIFESDIGMTPEQLSNREKRQISKKAPRWTNNTVYYYFTNNINEAKKQVFYDAFGHINSTTCVKFVENKTAKNRLKIITSNFCSSLVGMVGGAQEVEFGNGCVEFGTAVHELMHALGIYHTQERYDRDKYLNVDFSIIDKSWVSQVEKQTRFNTYNAVPFEYGSVMIYSRDDLGDGSMEPKNSDYARTMGNARVSFYDMQMVNEMYKCKCPTNMDCKNQGYTNPSDCWKCVCPSGYGGTLCDEQPENTIVRLATTTWTTYNFELGYRNKKLHTNYYKAHIWITAPSNTTIEVQILSMESFSCQNNCDVNGIEIKTNPDLKIVNPIICCDDDDLWNRIYSSETSPLVMAIYQRKSMSKFRFRYRYIE